MRRTVVLSALCALVLSAAAPAWAAEGKPGLRARVAERFNKAWAPIETAWHNVNPFARRALLIASGAGVAAGAIAYSGQGGDPKLAVPMAVFGVEMALSGTARDKPLSGVERVQTLGRMAITPLAIRVGMTDAKELFGGLPVVGRALDTNWIREGVNFGKGVASIWYGARGAVDQLVQWWADQKLSEKKEKNLFPYSFNQ
ncbi:MAG: hypothetical protein IT371_10735 [Deltaproteobacteria bacterium]|nr:hypothetical protein [Deltaproteobacteria bacterium]